MSLTMEDENKAGAPAMGQDLRHVTSSSALSPSGLSPRLNNNRLSQHYSLGVGGSMSPSSIPSSPTSVHSSSSAIFERDIELLPLPLSPSGPVQSGSGHGHPANPHHIARGHTTESLEQNVPSVLDSAAEILANVQVPSSSDVLIVEAPAPIHQHRAGSTTSGWASPNSVRSLGSFGTSRSPSPSGAQTQGSLLLSVPTTTLSSSPPRPTIATSFNAPPPHKPRMNSMDMDTPVTMDTPTSAYFSVKDDEEVEVAVDEGLERSIGEDSEEGTEEGHVTTKRDRAPGYPWSASSPHPSSPPHTSHTSPTSPLSPQSPQSHSHSISSLSTLSTKRLSFLSYTDLLTSTPTSTLPLSSLTTAANAGVEPPHITGVGSVIESVIGGGSSAGGEGQQHQQQQNRDQHTQHHHHHPSSVPSAPSSTASSSPPSSPLATPMPFGFGYPATGTMPTLGLGDSHGTLTQKSQQTQNTYTRAGSGVISPTDPSKRSSAIARSTKTKSHHSATHSNTSSNRTSREVFLDDLVGGEWEREGFGSGLEERLEGIMTLS
ncbi:hypothetical protein DFH05DRAFT_1458034 [Lentinula detonsa]|uniref:Uncharacterized protein n=1 Tax=Lentinula detonsa TaxID=2804962 RepID=A0A9W8P662_9AGAR|nr:hypothetical protein DFH05DRAFT_1458034 [Lentinula detonsa]